MGIFDDARERNERARREKIEQDRLTMEYEKYLVRLGPDTTGTSPEVLLSPADVRLAQEFLTSVASNPPHGRPGWRFEHRESGSKSIFRRQKRGCAYRIGQIGLPRVSRFRDPIDLYLCSDGLLRCARKAGPFKPVHGPLIGCIPDGATVERFGRHGLDNEKLDRVLMSYT